MELFEKSLLKRKIAHWHGLCLARGKGLRFLREPLRKWRQWARKQKYLRDREKNARRVVRICRIKNAVGLWSHALAKSKLIKAANIGRFMECMQPAHVPIAKRVGRLLESFQQNANSERTESPRDPESTENARVQILSLQNQKILLSQQDWDGIMSMKRIHFLLSHLKPNTDYELNNHLNSIPTGASFADMLSQGMLDAGICIDDSALPKVNLVDLIALAEAIARKLKEWMKSNPEVSKSLIQQHYISTGMEFNPLNPTSYVNDEIQTNPISALSDGVDTIDPEDLFDIEKESFLAQFEDFAVAENGEGSLVDAIIASANKDLSIMKQDVDNSLREILHSQKDLINYEEFVAKKKQQRMQCLHDIHVHCCKCRGPHVSKPPFSHGKDYRREPTHEQLQKSKCEFLRKKKEELKWLDNTLSKYSKNQQRFMRDIKTCEDVSKNEKEKMKVALANSLRMMEIVLP